ncbi:Tim44/TimA family putative adaptor protein [Novosphingobium beihaiensis]|uniref:Tim44/TimA family putative adaptor protein n=1 Tax=Novosphingobium beihaiensis TaxID=2930389 RepID=A0ABT0BUJ8_9SPHN|nr:Tim44/TimA family putative adaptor protein [Novosphingobium beihaiensis]MCJ2188726.1 Tim44/TimA family putative adaptor protein [Novosphingobium beihaiensis]
MTPEIVILAMIAAFLGLRLYSVLGRRAEHEEESIPGRFEGRQGRPGAPRVPAQPKPDAKADERSRGDQALRPREMPLAPPNAERGLAEIANADRRFDAFAFLEGARCAYRMILEAFWKGDKAELRHLCDDDVYNSFAAAIDARIEAGETLENRLVRIEECSVTAAGVENGSARITLRFRADIAAVTRNADGEVVAGSLDDAVEAVDLWTFTRALNSSDPDWLLDETDQG